MGSVSQGLKRMVFLGCAVMPTAAHAGVTTDSPTYERGDAITVDYDSMAAAYSSWISIEETINGDDLYAFWLSVGSSSSGSVVFDDAPVGTLEARFYTNGWDLVAADRSAPFTVSYPVGQDPTVSADQALYEMSSPGVDPAMTYTWTNAPGYTGDWLGVYVASETDNQFWLSYVYLNNAPGFYDGNWCSRAATGRRPTSTAIPTIATRWMTSTSTGTTRTPRAYTSTTRLS